jgi:nuclear pore complex protein Nup133
VYGARLTAFFAAYPRPELSWMHDIASKRYGAAAAALTVVDGQTAALAEKQLVASIAKLAAVAEFKVSGGGPHAVSHLDDELDNIAAQRALSDDLPDDVVPAALDHRPALKRVLEDGVDTLRAGDALSTEELVDVLTLKAGDRGGDGALAIERLQRDDMLPAGRADVALKSAWRRIYIRDDWTALANTAGRSEEDLRAGLRRTWAYATLAALQNTSVTEKFILSPAHAVGTPSEAEVSARYPALSGQDVAALMADQEDEARVLLKLVEAGLEKQVQGVRQLVKSDAEEEDGDVTME